MRHQRFFKLLYLMKALECVDKRGRIFALLPLHSARERKEKGISPDYSKSAKTLFIDPVNLANVNQIPFAPLRNLELLEEVLTPDHKQRSVQLALLDSRAPIPRHWLITYMTRFNHLCDEASGLDPVIDIRGCSRCRQKPFVTISSSGSNFYSTDKNLKEPLAFSKKDWESYILALLESGNEGERDLGTKYCRDPGLKLTIRIDEKRYMSIDPNDSSRREAECTG